MPFFLQTKLTIKLSLACTWLRLFAVWSKGW